MSMPGGGERVVINIEVNSDIATIEATREALERLTRAERDYGRARDSRPDGDDDGGGGGSGGGGGGGGGRRRGGGGGGRRTQRGRYEGFRGEVFDFRGDAGKAIASYGKLLKLVNKLSIIELPLLAAAIGGVSLAFKAGTYFVNMYRAAMSSMAGAVGIAFIAITTLVAAQKEFAAVQNSPAYYEGSVNTADRFIAAGNAMGMFVENSNLAVAGAKGLTSAFNKLSANAPVTGETTKAFETLMNVVVGSGGDIEKGTENLATFFNAIQKGGLSGGASAAKELGPDFEKIIKEAGALGVKTKEDFMRAAVEGNLGETFEKKYAGTLDALNNTLMGRFKIAISDIKSQLADIGGAYLGDAGNAVGRLQGIVQKTTARLAYIVSGWATTGKLNDVIDFIDRSSDKFILLMEKYLGTAPGIFGFFKQTFDSIGNAFDSMQDWLRTFKEASDVINRSFFGPIFDGVLEKFESGFGNVRTLILENESAIRGFADQIVNVIGAIGEYGNQLRTTIITALPIFTVLLKVIEMFFSGLAKVLSAVNAITGFLKKLGPIGKLLGGAVSVAALYGAIIITSRFFAVLGKMFGKKMNNMNINAGHVTVTGPGGVPGAPTPLGMPTTTPSGTRVDGRFGKGSLKGIVSFLGASNLAMAAGGAGLMSLGSSAGGYDTAGGSLLSSAGTGLTALGSARMLVGEEALGKGLSRTTKAGRLATGTLGTAAAGVAAIGALSYGAGSYIGGKFSDDSVKSRGTSAAASALAGAGIGAAIGSFVPIIGTGIGAAIGAAIGGVTGYIKAGKQRRETRKAAESLVDDYGSKINEAIAGGNVDDLLQARQQLIVDKQKLINTNADPAYAARAVAKYDAEFEKLNSQITNYTGNATFAESAFGVSAEALNNLALAAGIDLSAKILDVRDVLNLVGKSAEDNARLMKQAWSGIGAAVSGGVFAQIDKTAQAREASRAVDASATALLSGDTSASQIDNLIKQSMLFNTAEFGDFGGVGATDKGLRDALGEGGALAKLDPLAKAAILGRLDELDFSAQEQISTLSTTSLGTRADGTTITGIDRIGELLGSQALGDQGLLTAEGTVDSAKLKTFIQNQLTANPMYLAQLQSGTIAASQMNEDSASRQLLGKVLTGQPTTGVYGTSNMPTGSTQVKPVTNNVQVTVTGNVDQRAVKQIKDVVMEAIRQDKERGGSKATDVLTGGM